MSQVRLTGVVKWFDTAKGYGFITTENEVDVFVHFRDVQSEYRPILVQGEYVEFTIIQGQKGLRANDVVRLDGRES